MTTDCRVAIYSQDSLGLGHLRRNILIGGAILEARKDSNVLLLADSPGAPFFQLPTRMDHIKLPSICKVNAGCWEATRLRIDERELSRLRSDLLRDALLGFQPNLLLVDHMPGGAQGELLPALKALKQAHPKSQRRFRDTHGSGGECPARGSYRVGGRGKRSAGSNRPLCG